MLPNTIENIENVENIELKTNIISFPRGTHNKKTIQAQTQTVHKPQHSQKSVSSTTQEQNENILLVFEMLLALKEQLDNIQTMIVLKSKQLEN